VGWFGFVECGIVGMLVGGGWEGEGGEWEGGGGRGMGGRGGRGMVGSV
jgi:hypothetical protein